ncbi:MAG: glycosyltransferase [Bacteroidales bacterium]|jgi:glycosyltransferase involved in cell wall biosynthesis|nr:glycosyltransferase [Bacteroidales bacterium]
MQVLFAMMILSREYVGLGTATIEAMTLSIPCISNVPENLFWKTLQKDIQNIIYASMNVTEVTEKVSIVLSDISLRKSIGLTGKDFMLNNLGWDNVAKEMISLFMNKSQ